MLLSVSYSFATIQSGFSAKNWGGGKVRHFRWIRYLQNKITGNIGKVVLESRVSNAFVIRTLSRSNIMV